MPLDVEQRQQPAPTENEGSCVVGAGFSAISGSSSNNINGGGGGGSLDFERDGRDGVAAAAANIITAADEYHDVDTMVTPLRQSLFGSSNGNSPRSLLHKQPQQQPEQHLEVIEPPSNFMYSNNYLPSRSSAMKSSSSQQRSSSNKRSSGGHSNSNSSKSKSNEHVLTSPNSVIDAGGGCGGIATCEAAEVVYDSSPKAKTSSTTNYNYIQYGSSGGENINQHQQHYFTQNFNRDNNNSNNNDDSSVMVLSDHIKKQPHRSAFWDLDDSSGEGASVNSTNNPSSSKMCFPGNTKIWSSLRQNKKKVASTGMYLKF